MINYTAQYKFLDGGTVHGEVMYFPGAITYGDSLEEARRLIHSALIDLTQLSLERGEALPLPGTVSGDLDADLDEPIHLDLSATRKVIEVPEPATS
jgi:predicted RNase H-like HicB family nuclease